MATDAFLKIDDIQGESLDAKHQGEIEVLHWAWGMAQGGSAHSGSGAGAGKVSVQDLTFTKYSDKASPNLMKMCCSGKHFKSAKLTIRKAGGHPLEYFKVTMFDGLVSLVRMEGLRSGDVLAETIKLNFASFTCEYVPQGPDGSPTATIPAGWDIAKNAPR